MTLIGSAMLPQALAESLDRATLSSTRLFVMAFVGGFATDKCHLEWKEDPMLTNRVVRGYVVLIAGLIAFFGRRMLAGDGLWPPGLMDAEILSETEMWIVITTALLIGPAVALGRVRAMIIAIPFALPPLMLYLTFYPLLIVFVMLAMVPWMVHAALNAWMPDRAGVDG